jgi:tetratricopeptide (TPR) repeat protein
MLTGCISSKNRPAISSDIAGPVVLSTDEESLAHALANFGIARLYEGDEGPGSANAFVAYQQALAADPANHNLAARVAVLALRRQDPDTAIRVLEASYKRNPRNYTRTVDLAAAYQAAARLDDAIAQYRKALAIDQTPTAVYIALAGLLYQADRDAEALAVVNGGYATAVEPHLLSLYLYEQARRFLAHNLLDRAIPCFELLKARDERQYPGVHLVLAEIYSALNNAPRAIAVLEEAMAHPEPAPEIFAAMALSLFPAQTNRAIAVLEQAEQRFGENPHVLFSLGTIHSEFERPVDVVRLLEASRQLAIKQATADKAPPSFTEPFYLILAAAYDKLDRRTEAEAQLSECIEKFPGSHRALNFLAYLWADENRNLEKALTYSVRSLTHDPANAAYVDTLGWIYYRLGRFEEALQTITKAHALGGDDPEILLHLGDIQLALGNTEAAIAYWQQSITLDPTPANRAARQLEKHRGGTDSN